MIQKNVFEISETLPFQLWFKRLRDAGTKARINLRITRLREGQFGDVKVICDGVNELRIHHGPGYRVYFSVMAGEIVLLLMGGDKSTQTRDIRKAIILAKLFKE